MDWFWNWGGECFGYRDDDSLFTSGELLEQGTP
jgi:hypothetical protein